jgi:hypothetical protein
MAYRSFRGAPKGHVLSVVETAALRDVAKDEVVTPPIYRCLKKPGLIEQRLGRWILTQQGQILLMFSNAR